MANIRQSTRCGIGRRDSVRVRGGIRTVAGYVLRTLSLHPCLIARPVLAKRMPALLAILPLCSRHRSFLVLQTTKAGSSPTARALGLSSPH